MNKNILIAFLVVAVVSLGLMALLQNRQIAAIKKVHAQENAVLKDQAEAMAKAMRTVQQTKKVSAAERSAHAVSDRLTPAKVASAEPVAPGQSPTGMGTNLMGVISEMMKNPQMKEMVRAQQKVMTDQMYSALPHYLGISAETKAQLDKLLLDRQMAMADIGMAMMSGSEDERKKALADSKSVKDEYDLAIKELLGDKDYELFQQYEKSIPEQTSVTMFKNTLTGDDILNEQQEYELVAAMYQARKDLPQDSLLNRQNQSPDPSQLSEARIADTLKQMELLQQRYALAAESILAVGQLERFKQWQQQMADMQRAGIGVAAQMFGQGKPGASSPQK